MTRRKALSGGIAAALFAFLSASTQAVPTLDLLSGSSNISIFDNGPLDNDPALGVISFSGSVGSFTGTFTTGITLPAIGSATRPQLSLTSTDITSDSSGGLTIIFGEVSAFGPTSGALVSHITGTNSTDLSTTGGISYTTFTTGSALTAQGPFTSAFYNDTARTSAVLSANSDLFQQVVLNLLANTTSEFNATLSITPVGSSVPDTGLSVWMLSSAILVLTIVRRCV